MKTKYIIANWKQNPENIETAKRLLILSEKFHTTQKFQDHLVLTHAAPTLFAGYLIEENKEANIILQNVSEFSGGSHTGELSAKQAKNLGIKMSIIGHSETRLSPKNPKGDEDIQINSKLKNLINEDMLACLCVGEYERDANYQKFIEEQINKCLQDISGENLKNIIIAYEPVWAIGKDAKRVAGKNEIVETINFIKKYLDEKYGKNDVKVLYGGSVDENNAKSILDIESVDGLLIGRASSDPEKWEMLLNNLNNMNKNISANFDKITPGTRVLLRLDLNVPTDEDGNIQNDFRIQESIPLIKKLQDLQAKVIIVAHKEKGSLEKVAKYTEKYLQKITFLECFGKSELERKHELEKLNNIKNGEIYLLENIRLDEREKSKDKEKRDELAQELSKYADIYINEAFSASHRDHASTTSLPKFLPSYFGLSMEKEITNLSLGLRPEHPLLLIVGGAKFDTKLPMIEKFLIIADKIFVGGALAHSFWKNKKYNLGKSLIDEEVKLSVEVLNSGKILLPVDVVVEDKSIKHPENLGNEEKIVDFGPETLKFLRDVAQNSKTIIWNGPIGYYEKGFDTGTKELLILLSKMSEKNILLGGGDTVTEIDKVKAEGNILNFTHISTGGGAMIEFLSNGPLPGITAVEKSQ